MFGWHSEESQLKKARLREAYRRQLSEVLGLPEDAPRETPEQARPEAALQMDTTPALSRAC